MSAGLTVRWSLAQAPADVAQKLRSYVTESSHSRFEELEGLRFKTWRMREGEWFEGIYVFIDDAARQKFAQDFAAKAAGSPGSVLIGSGPILIEESEIVAVAIGPEGAQSLPLGERQMN
ncbi:MAG TPA: hypothetical protein PKX56_01875 [Marmoricola sp.]|nr:hypothetical protein [Marmoricola sp.]HNJ78075.1 hypothetical protein [Marmoricola sp.]HNN48928.1 hypothetical protein [Marmoricola sp.]HNO39495.1 hypothetical protein [Marmoricola sp.]